MVGDPGLGHASKYLYVTSFLELLGSRPRLTHFVRSDILVLYHRKVVTILRMIPTFLVGDPGLEPGTERV